MAAAFDQGRHVGADGGQGGGVFFQEADGLAQGIQHVGHGARVAIWVSSSGMVTPVWTARKQRLATVRRQSLISRMALFCVLGGLSTARRYRQVPVDFIDTPVIASMQPLL